MPNWVFNNVKIVGDEATITEVRERLAKPLPPQHEREGASAFSFWNIIAPTEDKYEEYFGTRGFQNGEQVGYTANNWYEFNNREWGTKWDAGDVGFSQPDSTTLRYSFDTAWSPPVRALEHLSAQYPDLVITNDWQEEQGFGSMLTFKAGEHEEDEGYDWACNDCDYKFSGDTNDIWDDELQETVCPKCAEVKTNA